MDENKIVAKNVIIHGRVQGVGFRWTTAQIATSFHVVGSVRNLSDGTVELVAQSSPIELQRFVDRILERLESNVTDVIYEDIPVDSSLSEFAIRR